MKIITTKNSHKHSHLLSSKEVDKYFLQIRWITPFFWLTHRGRPGREALEFGEDEIAHLPLAAGSRCRSSLASASSATGRHL
uniref:Uncharacterized protein MANES_05G073700 n=1 Tax=Rhizophora mucronata TaxID=61149 RepID=A0A2P2LKJ3_RHIMU